MVTWTQLCWGIQGILRNHLESASELSLQMRAIGSHGRANRDIGVSPRGVSLPVLLSGLPWVRGKWAGVLSGFTGTVHHSCRWSPRWAKGSETGHRMYLSHNISCTLSCPWAQKEVKVRLGLLTSCLLFQTTFSGSRHRDLPRTRDLLCCSVVIAQPWLSSPPVF